MYEADYRSVEKHEDFLGNSLIFHAKVRIRQPHSWYYPLIPFHSMQQEKNSPLKLFVKTQKRNHPVGMDTNPFLPRNERRLRVAANKGAFPD